MYHYRTVGRSLLFLLLNSACNDFENEAFDRHKWAQGDYQVRGRMYHDFLSDHKMEGMTREEVAYWLTIPRDTVMCEWTYHLDLGWTALFHMDVHYDRVPRRTSNGWRAPLSFAQPRRSEERILDRSIRLRSNKVWANESKR